MDDSTAAVRALRRSPAQGMATAMSQGSSEQVRLREVPYAVMTTVRVQPGTGAAGRIEAVLGCALPGGVGQVTSAGERQVLWLGPDEFLTWSPDGEAAAVAVDAVPALLQALGTERGQVVEVSSNRTTLQLEGPRAASVLSKGCALDLHPRVWPAGLAYATVLARVPVVIWRVEDDVFRILPRSSFAEHLVLWLLDAMTEFRDPSGTALWR